MLTLVAWYTGLRPLQSTMLVELGGISVVAAGAPVEACMRNVNTSSTAMETREARRLTRAFLCHIPPQHERAGVPSVEYIRAGIHVKFRVGCEPQTTVCRPRRAFAAPPTCVAP